MPETFVLWNLLAVVQQRIDYFDFLSLPIVIMFFMVVIAPGFHLFPSRTEKLSPDAPMVLHTRGRVGRRHFFESSSLATMLMRNSFFVFSFICFSFLLLVEISSAYSLPQMRYFFGSDKHYLPRRCALSPAKKYYVSESAILEGDFA